MALRPAGSELGDLIAEAAGDFVRIAAKLAEDGRRLAHVRSALRPTMSQSPLMQAELFTSRLKSAYRDAWQNRCAG